MDTIKLNPKRKNHIIKPLFSQKKMDRRAARTDWSNLGGKEKRFDYIVDTPTARLTAEEEEFFKNFFGVESVYKASKQKKQSK